MSLILIIWLKCQTVSSAPGHPQLQVYAKLMTKNVDYDLLNGDDDWFLRQPFSLES